MKKNKFQIKREATYAKLVQAGFEVFYEKGYSGSSIDDIVMRAGYTKGAFYVHFESKEHFFLDLLQLRTEARTEIMSSILGDVNSSETLEEAVKLVAQKAVENLTKAPEWFLVYVDFYNLAKYNDVAMERYRNYYQVYIEEIKEFIELLKRKQLLPVELDSLEKAKMIYSFMDGCLLHYNFYREMLNETTLSKMFLTILRMTE